jgi:uncharacterized protein DUF4337
MEEGPEPQEWVERTSEEVHHGHHPGSMVLEAITAATLAVLAALGSLLSGHAANQAILAQTRAVDQWAYFQSKGTRGHLYEVGGEVVKALSENQTDISSDRIKSVVNRFEEKSMRYDREKQEIRREAERLEGEAQHEFHKHHHYALGVASFQIGIVLASVSILVRYRLLYLSSLATGGIGFALLLLGLSS